jgi:hypothetical protein
MPGSMHMGLLHLAHLRTTVLACAREASEASPTSRQQ